MTLPIRVAHVVWRLSPTGGIPRVVRDLCVALDPRSIETSVVSVRPAYAEDLLDDVVPPDRFLSANLELGTAPWRRALCLPIVTRRLRALRPDVIHLHSGTSWLGVPAAASMPGARRLLDVHDEPQSRRSSPGNLALMRLSVRRLRFAVVTHSSVVRARTASAFGVAPNDISLVPLGVDDTLFHPDQELRTRERARLGVDESQHLVVWVGRVDPLKRPSDAIAVAVAVTRKLPDVVFALAGAGSELDSTRTLAAGHPNIRVLGAVEDVAAFLNAGDVYLSTSAYEGFGLTIAEAMATGLPVVATEAGGVVDLVESGVTGHLTPIGDVEGLADRVVKLLGDEPARRRMSVAATERAQAQFTRPAMAAGYEALYRRLLRP
jgi:glycosyltransferase involved in cell wall biosynthesis